MIKSSLSAGFGFSVAMALISAACLQSQVAWAKGATDPVQVAEDERNASAPAITEAITSSQPTRRARAAVALGRIQRAAVVDPLLKLLHDPAPRVRAAAAFGLGQLGWETQALGERAVELVDALGSLASDPAVPVRLAVVEALGKLPVEDSEARIAPFLADFSKKVQAEALTALFRYRYVLAFRGLPAPAPVAQTTLDAVIALGAQTSGAPLRRNVAYLLNRLRDPRALDAVLALAADRNVNARLFALAALGKIGSADNASVAQAAFDSKNTQIRVAVIQALKALKALGSLPAEKVATDPSFHVRATYAELYAASGLTDEAPLLKLWSTEEKSTTVRSYALSTLATLRGAASLELLSDAMKSSSWILRETAVAASANLAEADRETFLVQASSDADVRVRAAALEALGPIATPSAYAAIRTGLKATSLAERGSAVGALVQRPETDAADVAWGCYQDSLDRRWIELREQLVDFIGSVPGDVTTGYLAEAQKDPARSVALIAQEALKKRGWTELPELPNEVLTHSPYAHLQFERNPRVILLTTRGEIELELYPRQAPVHVANLIGLAKAGFYDGLLWHRVVSNFVIQGGDPDGTGWGDAGFSIRAEINGIRFHRGTLGMARAAGFDTAGVQFFINHIPTPHLDGLYTAFGQVVRGLEVVDLIERGDQIISAKVE